MIKVLKTVNELISYRKNISYETSQNKTSVGFVPTMGSLHEGHFELIRNSQKHNKITVVSIFVNPAQFNNREDFNSYPNHLNADLKALEDRLVDAVFIPTESEVYPKGYTFKLTESVDSLDLCGLNRPGHFDGVLTVLIKLFNLVQPSNVYMGLKDYQQYLLVKNMARDMFLNLEIVGVETVRESSGLALSSRNFNLTPVQKVTADKYAKIFADTDDLVKMQEQLGLLDLKVDYLKKKWGRKFIAVVIGNMRLIDNRLLKINTENKLETKFSSKLENTVSLQNNSNLKKEQKLDKIKIKNNKIDSKNILFKMSGSIACFKSCDVISKLVQLGHNVRVAATPDVFQFVGKATLEGLTGSAVYSNLYENGEMMSHIHLNDWADLIVLCPASANTLAKVSMGLSDNIVTALALSTDTKKPYLIFPAMNTRMLEAKPIQEAIKNLEQMDKKIIFGSSGHLACGHIGSGRLAEVDCILNEIELAINKTSATKFLKPKVTKKILVTAGGTSEPIDPVRYVTNTSTGDTGLKISKYLSDTYDVYLLGAECMKHKTEDLKDLIQIEYFKSFVDLKLKLESLLSTNHFDAIIHLAAVSDYSPNMIHFNDKSIELPTSEKISSSEDFIIEFKRNEKLISNIKNLSLNKNIKVVGFKLLRTDDSQKIQNEIDKVLKDSECVVVNSLENISDQKHAYEIYNLSGLVFHGNSKENMAEDISKILGYEAKL